MCSMLDCHCYGQHSNKNKSDKNRNKTRTIKFCKSCFYLRKDISSYKWCSLCHFFCPCINGPNATDKLDYMSVTSEQWLVLAVVNSSDWDTDDYMQSFNGLDKEIWKIKKLLL